MSEVLCAIIGSVTLLISITAKYPGAMYRKLGNKSLIVIYISGVIKEEICDLLSFKII